MASKVIAICYDFDKTLATNNMQSFSFIPSLGMKDEEFWAKCYKQTKKNGMDSTLSYLKLMIDECKKKGIRLSREYLQSMGKNIEFFDGVSTWFRRLNIYAQKKGLTLEHYIISSGNKEIIEGCSIFKEFKNVFGCEFLYNEQGEAVWPKNLVNYTLKTQYLFRICKGLNDLTDEETINQKVAEKHVEFRNMIYIGDGMTDIPCMVLIKEKGGVAVSVYPPDKKEASVNLVKDNRVNYACRSDFRSGAPLEKLIKLIIDSMDLKDRLLKKEQDLSKKISH